MDTLAVHSRRQAFDLFHFLPAHISYMCLLGGVTTPPLPCKFLDSLQIQRIDDVSVFVTERAQPGFSSGPNLVRNPAVACSVHNYRPEAAVQVRRCALRVVPEQLRFFVHVKATEVLVLENLGKLSLDFLNPGVRQLSIENHRRTSTPYPVSLHRLLTCLHRTTVLSLPVQRFPDGECWARHIVDYHARIAKMGLAINTLATIFTDPVDVVQNVRANVDLMKRQTAIGQWVIVLSREIYDAHCKEILALLRTPPDPSAKSWFGQQADVHAFERVVVTRGDGYRLYHDRY